MDRIEQDLSQDCTMRGNCPSAAKSSHCVDEVAEFALDWPCLGSASGARSGVRATVCGSARKPTGRRAHHLQVTTYGASIMSKGQHGNKEARKPKKVHLPNPPGLPASLAPLVASPLRPKKK
jgi:hypothetical protein